MQYSQFNVTPFTTVNPKVATPPTPSQDMWSVAPANQQQADAIVQSISNATVAAQQGIDATQVQYINQWVPSWLIPNPSDPNAIPIPWTTYMVIGGAILGIVLLGGRR